MNFGMLKPKQLDVKRMRIHQTSIEDWNQQSQNDSPIVFILLL